MDGLTGLLDGVRARGAFVLRLSLDPPWAMDVRDRAPLTVLCQTRGAAVIVPETGDPVRLEAGDTARARRDCRGCVQRGAGQRDGLVEIHRTF